MLESFNVSVPAAETNTSVEFLHISMGLVFSGLMVIVTILIVLELKKR